MNSGRRISNLNSSFITCTSTYLETVSVATDILLYNVLCDVNFRTTLCIYVTMRSGERGGQEFSLSLNIYVFTKGHSMIANNATES
jgi:hypothetical protein